MPERHAPTGRFSTWKPRTFSTSRRRWPTRAAFPESFRPLGCRCAACVPRSRSRWRSITACRSMVRSGMVRRLRAGSAGTLPAFWGMVGVRTVGLVRNGTWNSSRGGLYRVSRQPEGWFLEGNLRLTDEGRSWITLNSTPAAAFSFLRGASSPEDLARRAAELGLPALAVLDRDGVYGAPRFFAAARAHGLAPHRRSRVDDGRRHRAAGPSREPRRATATCAG